MVSTTTGSGIVDHPLRAALTLFLIGLAGPAAVLQDQAGRLLDSAADQTPVRAVAADSTPIDS
ncbi:hypothetical protein [Streptomyces albireticuli]|uniref:Uncharacterized protein n=1 Tax=Streptomyces albireticuli TaxID=1940 RepID=A0A2A2D6A0_9ACTN|nr:hypothetical protein [Streptomyces albireticuli]MCD9145914.1 hypothetical protein [Streptomyces albireticuli]MCD9166084.1 hypothetical protein [Streptomyces albireticuli]MCD9196364.1 hypothetical protein [Streptomyces albireticuli]PAU47983.1 hypothetical protein CK936_15860 [Streptomyces albireticuli]